MRLATTRGAGASTARSDHEVQRFDQWPCAGWMRPVASAASCGETSRPMGAAWMLPMLMRSARGLHGGRVSWEPAAAVLAANVE
jgi:hypothetical protein